MPLGAYAGTTGWRCISQPLAPVNVGEVLPGVNPTRPALCTTPVVRKTLLHYVRAIRSLSLPGLLTGRCCLMVLRSLGAALALLFAFSLAACTSDAPPLETPSDTATTAVGAAPEPAASRDPATTQDAAPQGVAPQDAPSQDTASGGSAGDTTADAAARDTARTEADGGADAGETEPAANGATGTARSETAPPTGDRRALQTARETATNFGLRVALAVLVLVLTFFAIKGVSYVLEALAERSAERRLLYKRIVPIARVILWAVALYVVLRGIFEVDAQGLIAAAAAIGVAVGFAAQDLLKNIFGGLVIIFDTPFQVGDKIRVGGTYGEVVAIGLRSTRIVTPDDNLVSVPNSQIVDGQVSNANAGALDCQVVTDLYLPGWADETKAVQIARQAAASSKYVYLQKPIAVIVTDEYDDGHVVHLKVKAYVLDARYEFLLMSDITERARRAFRNEGLLVPANRVFLDLPGAAGTPETTA